MAEDGRQRPRPPPREARLADHPRPAVHRRAGDAGQWKAAGAGGGRREGLHRRLHLLRRLGGQDSRQDDPRRRPGGQLHQN